jgi:hypothetical protein
MQAGALLRVESTVRTRDWEFDLGLTGEKYAEMPRTLSRVLRSLAKKKRLTRFKANVRLLGWPARAAKKELFGSFEVTRLNLLSPDLRWDVGME